MGLVVGVGVCVWGSWQPRTPGEYDYARSTFTTLLRLMTVSEGQVWGVCDDLLDDEERVGLCESIHVIACQADSLGKRAKRLSEATVVLIEKERERLRLEKHAAPRRSPRATRSQSKAWQPLKHEEVAVRKTRYDTRDDHKTMLTHSKNERHKAKKEATKRKRVMGKQKEQDTKSTVGDKAKDQAIEERADFYDMVRLGRTLAGLPPTPSSVKGVRSAMGKRIRIRGKRQP